MCHNSGMIIDIGHFYWSLSCLSTHISHYESYCSGHCDVPYYVILAPSVMLVTDVGHSPQTTHSYQANNLLIIPLCYIRILSASSARKCVPSAIMTELVSKVGDR